MKAYYINLARRTDRRAALEAQLDRLGIKAERIEAILAADLPDDLRQAYLPNGQHQRLSVQEFCVGVSHLDAYRRLLSGNDAHGLILEDDIVLSPSLPQFLADFETSAIGTDLLRIETFGSPAQISTRPRETLGQFGFHSMHGWAWGAAAYVISRAAAQAMLDNTRSLDEVIDRVLYRPHRTVMGAIKRRQLVPALGIQLDRIPGPMFGQGSDITPTRTQREKEAKPQSFRQALSTFVENEVSIALPASLHRIVALSGKRDIPYREN